MKTTEHSQAGVMLSVPLIGQQIDNYEVIDVIGSGGWGTVYLARHFNHDEMVAIKLLHRHLLSSSEKLERFQREAQAASLLRSVGAPRVKGHGILSDGQPYIIFEYAEGATLQEILADRTLPPSQVRAIILQLCTVLKEAHGLGLLHRDIKPSNIMVSRDSDGCLIVKLLDFGLAKNIDIDQDSLTDTGLTVGTPAYMSPEQCSGRQLDARSDIYSLGCVMYQALTGHLPFEGSNQLELLQMQIYQAPAPMAMHGVRVGPALQSVVLRALEKDPRCRYQSARELESDMLLIGTDCKRLSSGQRRSLLIAFLLCAIVLTGALLAVKLTIGAAVGVAPNFVESQIMPTEAEKALRSQLLVQADKLLEANDFTKLDELGRTLNGDHITYFDGRTPSDDYFNNLSLVSADNWQPRLNKLRAWSLRMPASPYARVAIAETLISVAWTRQHHTYALMTPAERASLHAALQAASDEFLKARQLAPQLPRVSLLAQELALFEGEKAYEDAFAQGVRAHPGYTMLQLHKTVSLHPSWQGSAGDWQRYAVECANRLPGAASDIMYARTILFMQTVHLCPDPQSDPMVDWQRVSTGCRAAGRQYPSFSSCGQ